MSNIFVKISDKEWCEVKETDYEAINNALEVSSLSAEELCLELSTFKEKDLSEYRYWSDRISLHYSPIYYGDNVNDLISYTIKYKEVQYLSFMDNIVLKAFQDNTIDVNRFDQHGRFLRYQPDKIAKQKKKAKKDEQNSIIWGYEKNLYNHCDAYRYINNLLETIIGKNICNCHVYTSLIQDAEDIIKKIRKINKSWKSDKQVQSVVNSFLKSYEWYKSMPEFVAKRRKRIMQRKITYTPDIVKFFKKLKVKEIVK